MTTLRAFLRDQSGASAGEYAVVLALLAIAVVGGIGALAGAFGRGGVFASNSRTSAR